jgi:SM-20-related protein
MSVMVQTGLDCYAEHSIGESSLNRLRGRCQVPIDIGNAGKCRGSEMFCAEILNTSPKIVHRNLAGTGTPLPDIRIFDDVLSDDQRRSINNFLHQPGWKFGWRSHAKDDQFSFWHKHFAGNKNPDHYEKDGAEQQYDCEDELHKHCDILYDFWKSLQQTVLAGHTLIRCYANGAPFGSEGTLHTDSISPRSYTAVYYPHKQWQINWAGETVLYDPTDQEITASIYPKPNRLLIFNGAIPHVARGVSRSCPVLRATLMFKTEVQYDK